MINPNELYHAKGVITKVVSFASGNEFTVELENGSVKGYDLPEKFRLNDKVSVWCQFSIMLDEFRVRKIHRRSK